MSMTKVRLTIDSQAEGERDKAMIADLHEIVVAHVLRMNIQDAVKVTIEYEGPSRRRSMIGAENLEAAAGNQEEKPLGLSERQLQIAEMLCNHYSMKRIAEELYVSVNTVKKHIQNMKKTLQIERSGADFIFLLKELLYQVV
ncbi:response regulator transcription factor [Paenibacillus hexagrammi]|uniref:LuxR C-terminal-related transcriptional regulator n=1 Tax=Paenibacillus hexagrammi TaxID=2908839 RepID=A0ABY3SPV3_9BACL|nr:LuxR C-terminal-related transcriptional regulator [Paenibacillus sp. YPD9-1]UJF36082.1 LuxR C-terminal-related transcriptional regulator [Paenibacillus sp. YPD9-1]